jgi:antitoxin (DNA-binding transcriptional repressor) of toxin-antitoxin stability system
MKRIALLLSATAIAGLAQSLPPEIRDALTAEFHFTQADLETAESGRPVAKLVPTGRPDDVRLVGVVRIKVSSDDFIKAFRDVERFQSAKEVIRTGLFSSPPVEADLAGCKFGDLNRNDLLACRPGKCSYKLPASLMTDLTTKIDWNTPDSMDQAQRLIHEVWLQRLGQYQHVGDPALAVYYDSSSPFSVAEGLHSLIKSETRLGRRFPDLVRYATEFPASRPAGVDDLYYWQEAAFGLKHVVRTSHVIIQELPSEAGNHYAVISKLLFASHYFRAAFEFNYVYPVKTSSGEPAVYFVAAQRSYVDGLTGVRGAILRKVAESRSPATLAENLRLARERLEHKQ